MADKAINWIVGIGIVIILAILIVLISSTFSTPTGNVIKSGSSSLGPIRIGSILPLTGDAASIGESTRNAIELAVSEINGAGGINGKNMEVIYEDGSCGPKGATNAANKLVNVDGVPIIIGGACSSETLAAAPIAENKGTVMISPCSTNPDVTNAGDYIFRNMPSDSFQGIYAAEVAYNDLGARNVAILYCLSDWCVAIKDVYKNKFNDLGGNIVIEEAYEQNSKDLRTQLTKIKEANPDIIYFLGYTEGSIIGLKQIKEMGINVPIIGGDGWDDPKIWSEAGEAGEGVRYTMVSTNLPSSFKSKMGEKTGTDEITVCAPQAYDAAHIIAEIMKKVGTDSQKIKDELYKVRYSGVSGLNSFDENGDLEQGTFITKIVRNGKAVVEN